MGPQKFHFFFLMGFPPGGPLGNWGFFWANYWGHLRLPGRAFQGFLAGFKKKKKKRLFIFPKKPKKSSIWVQILGGFFFHVCQKKVFNWGGGGTRGGGNPFPKGGFPFRGGVRMKKGRQKKKKKKNRFFIVYDGLKLREGLFAAQKKLQGSIFFGEKKPDFLFKKASDYGFKQGRIFGFSKFLPKPSFFRFKKNFLVYLFFWRETRQKKPKNFFSL